jgi:hypothetical protein
MTKTTVQHFDIMDQPLGIGDAVACPHHNSLMIGFVEKINPKMVGVKFSGWLSHKNKYPRDLVKIDGGMAMIYLLKHTK